MFFRFNYVTESYITILKDCIVARNFYFNFRRKRIKPEIGQLERPVRFCHFILKCSLKRCFFFNFVVCIFFLNPKFHHVKTHKTWEMYISILTLKWKHFSKNLHFILYQFWLPCRRTNTLTWYGEHVYLFTSYESKNR